MNGQFERSDKLNLVDCYVTEVTGAPRELYGKWWVPVNYISEGCSGNTEIMCWSLEEVDKVKVGAVFQQ